MHMLHSVSVAAPWDVMCLMINNKRNVLSGAICIYFVTWIPQVPCLGPQSLNVPTLDVLVPY
jgi:hypothetical protein